MTSEPRVDLLLLGADSSPDWELGHSLVCKETPAAMAEGVDRLLANGSADALLTWSAQLGSPDPEVILGVLKHPGDVWHAGLARGMAGLPGLLSYVKPTWMLSADPPAKTEASSWRVSLEACLVRTDVVRRLGGPSHEFESIAGCSLELGHRYASAGALPRYSPLLVGTDQRIESPVLPITDEVRFLGMRAGRFWTRWALVRALLGRRIKPWEIAGLWKLAGASASSQQRRRTLAMPSGSANAGPGSVTVLIPTLDRYDYLDKLLEQIAVQTVPPDQVVVVDQTQPERRRQDLVERHPRVPLEVLYRERPGQCSSRNAGLEVATGDYVLFLDDDDEVEDDLIERHLNTLVATGADVSSGVADEVGAGELPDDFRIFRLSDVFPTNNTLVRRSALERSGLFDLAYEHGPRADGDLGMRVYLSGALMVLNPETRVLHHHATSGGLRAHGARAVTYASSRTRLLHRHLPATTEIYLARRYFSPHQVREALLLRIVGTFVIRGSKLRKVLKILAGSLLLPHTLLVVAWRFHQTTRLLQDFPQIPYLKNEAQGSSEL